MEVYSNQPGVQFYNSNFIPEDPKQFKGNSKDLKTLPGKEGNYYKHGALCLETQNYPDAVNHVSGFHARFGILQFIETCLNVFRKIFHLLFCIQVKLIITRFHIIFLY